MCRNMGGKTPQNTPIHNAHKGNTKQCLSCSNLVLCTMQAALFLPPIQVGEKAKGRLREVDVYGPKTIDK